MFRISILIFVAFLLFLGATAEATELRILTYNIHHGEGMDRRIDLERIAGIITSVRPDLVALQEVDVKTERSGGVDQASVLGRLTGMREVFGRAIDFAGGEYGNAILSVLPIAATEIHPLSFSPGHERRIILEIQVFVEADTGERMPIRFLATHLDHTSDPTDRLAAVPIINRFAEEQPDMPTVLAGDLNAEPESDVLRRLFNLWNDSIGAGDRFTWPAEEPDRRIDYILYQPESRWAVRKFRVLDETVASDHRPVFAVLELKKK